MRSTVPPDTALQVESAEATVRLLYDSRKPLVTCLFSGSWNGGASRDRTDDLIVANDALSQLSYSPTLEVNNSMILPVLPRVVNASAIGKVLERKSNQMRPQRIKMASASPARTSRRLPGALATEAITS